MRTIMSKTYKSIEKFTKSEKTSKLCVEISTLNLEWVLIASVLDNTRSEDRTSVEIG